MRILNNMHNIYSSSSPSPSGGGPCANQRTGVRPLPTWGVSDKPWIQSGSWRLSIHGAYRHTKTHHKIITLAVPCVRHGEEEGWG